MGDEGSGGYVVNNCLDSGRRNGTFGMNIFVASAFFFWNLDRRNRKAFVAACWCSAGCRSLRALLKWR
jgi:hypothetical protein